jgi:hypothetical protein
MLKTKNFNLLSFSDGMLKKPISEHLIVTENPNSGYYQDSGKEGPLGSNKLEPARVPESPLSPLSPLEETDSTQISSILL